jgi:Cd2+/Zn2+-exporting ATPase
MVLAFLGITSIWFAIFADVGVALLALLNAMRAMYIN